MRIHFSRGDLARTRLAEGADVAWEVINSLHALQAAYGGSILRAWRKATGPDLAAADLGRRVRDRLFPVAPNASYFPDLLTPPEGALGLGEALETVVSAPRRRLRQEFGALRGSPGAGPWLADLAAGRTAALRELAATLSEYHRVSVEPHWESITTSVAADLAFRRRALREHGIAALLATFRPMMRWEDPVLHLPIHPSGRDVHLRGRGLVLIPSYFCRRHPLTIFSAELPQVVVYPVELPLRAAVPSSVGALERLLGETRAAVLLAVRAERTTGELSRDLGVAPATISHHTGILREAGLIHSRRTANTMLHTLSPLGAALLNRHPWQT
ncbi:ArsR/SmtB family transcription factor [Nonomuraea longicatena]|uniref:Winged helix-turn-helix domain-containing protein n=1 Tax=Nonomuraea longicatena TaxID=83682 RepID=A0ABP4ATC3_9ACTN